VLFMRRYGSALHGKTADPFERLRLVERIARLTPTQTRRSEEMLEYQQFSTPLGLGWRKPGNADRKKLPGAAWQ